MSRNSKGTVKKAITLAIAAMMMLSTPLNAIAAEEADYSNFADYSDYNKYVSYEQEQYNNQETTISDPDVKAASDGASAAADYAAEAATYASAAASAVSEAEAALASATGAVESAEAQVANAAAAASSGDSVDTLANDRDEAMERVSDVLDPIAASLEASGDLKQKEETFVGVAEDAADAYTSSDAANTAASVANTADTKEKDLEDKAQEHNNNVATIQATVNEGVESCGATNTELGTTLESINGTTEELNTKIENATKRDLASLKKAADSNAAAAQEAYEEAYANFQAALELYNQYVNVSDSELQNLKTEINGMNITVDKTVTDAAAAYLQAKETLDQAKTTAANAIDGTAEDIATAKSKNSDAKTKDELIKGYAQQALDILNGDNCNVFDEDEDGKTAIEKDLDEIISTIESGKAAFENAESSKNSAVSVEVNKAQAAVDETQGKIDVINDAINGTEDTQGLTAQISDKKAAIGTKTTEVGNKESAYKKIENDAKAYASSTWDSLGWGKLAYFGIYSLYENELVENAKNTDAYKNAYKQYVAANNELTNLKSGLTALENAKTAKEEELAILTTELANRNAALTQAESDRTAAENKYSAAVAKATEAAVENISAALEEAAKNAVDLKSDEINLDQYELALYEWANDWSKIAESRDSRRAAKNVRETLDSKYGLDGFLESLLDYFNLTQGIIGTDKVSAAINLEISKYYGELKAAEIEYYETLARNAYAAANEANTKLENANSTVTEDQANGVKSLQNTATDLTNRNNTAMEQATAYSTSSFEDKTAAITGENGLQAQAAALKTDVNNLGNEAADYETVISTAQESINNSTTKLASIKEKANSVTISALDLSVLKAAVAEAERLLGIATTALTNAGVAKETVSEMSRKAAIEAARENDDDSDEALVDNTDDDQTANAVVAPVTVQTSAQTVSEPALMAAAANTQTVLGRTRTASQASAEVTTEEAVAEETKTEDTAVAETQDQQASEDQQTAQETTTIADAETAKAATAEVADKTFPWWILAILAVAGFAVEELVRRKKNKE